MDLNPLSMSEWQVISLQLQWNILLIKQIIKPKLIANENPRNVEEINIPQENREEILNELRQVLKKLRHLRQL